MLFRSAFPYVVAIVAMFASFMVVLGGVAIWSELPKKRVHKLRSVRAPIGLRHAA